MNQKSSEKEWVSWRKKKKNLDYGNLNDQGDGLSLAEKRIWNLENYNHNLVNQMISILTSINNNISSLAKMWKARGLLDENDEKDRARDKTEEDMTTNITFGSLDWTCQKKQEHMAEEIHKAYEAAKTMQELERKIEE